MKFLSSVIITSLFVSAAMANNPCEADRAKFCPDIKMDGKPNPETGKKLFKCMKEHEAELSAECKEMRDKMKEAAHDVREACAADREKFCTDKKMGKGLMKCMKAHEAELSETCKSEIKEKKEMRKAMKK